jgi:hypothetical protein
VQQVNKRKTVLKSIKGLFSSLFKANSCGQYFSDYATNSGKVCKITISVVNNFFTIGFAKNSIDRVLEVITKEFKNLFIFDLWRKFKGQNEANFLILDLKNVCCSVQ